MATSLKNYPVSGIGLTATTVYNPTTSGVQSTVIGLTLANTTTVAVNASVTLTSGSTTVYLIKNTSIPAGNSLSVLRDSKFIVEENDVIQVQSSAAASIDALLSAVEIV